MEDIKVTVGGILQGHWDFNQGGAGGFNSHVTTLTDNSGNNNDGTLQNFTLSGATSNWITSTCNTAALPVASTNALDFDGTDDYVSFSNTISDYILNTGTVEAWFKTSDAGTGYRGIVTKEHSYGIFLQDNELGIFNWGIGGSWKATGIYPNDGNWHHVAMVFDEDVVNGTKLYLDGVLVLQTTIDYFWAHVNTNLKIGRNTATQNFAGQIDDVRIWNDIRTPSEIQNNHTSELNGSEAGLVGYYKFDQGVANGDNTNPAVNTLEDNKIGGTAHNGTLSGFALNGTTSNWVSGTTLSAALPISANASLNLSTACANASSWNVPMGIDQDLTLGAISFVLDYDQSTLTFNGFSSTNTDINTNGLINDDGDKLTFAWNASSSAGVSYTANSALLSLDFTPNTSGAAASPAFTWSVTAGDCEFADNSAAIIASSFNNATGSIVVPATPTLSSDATNNTICAGETITFTAGGGTSYEFFVNNVSQGAASATNTFSSSTLTDGQVVTVTVADANGCSATSTGITVTVNALPTPTLVSDATNNTICAGETITFTAGGLSTGSGGGSLHFLSTGAPDNASTSNPNLPQGTSPFTVEAWMKSDMANTGQEVMLCYGSSGFAHHQRVTLWITNTGQLMFNTNNGITSLTGSTIIKDGNWHHCAVTYDGSTLNLYVDGVLDGTKTLTTTNLNITGSAYSLGADLGSGPFYSGTLDEVRVWDFTKTAAQINAQKNVQLIGSETGLVSYINFNDGAGTTATDLSPSGADFTLHNFSFGGGNVSDWSTDLPFAQGGGGTYEFFVDNVSQGAASTTNTFSSSSLTDGQIVKVTATNADGCSVDASITVTVNPLPTAGLVSDKTNNEICAGETITFSASGGTSYEFFVDNVSQGAASATATFASSTLTNGQVVTATVTSTNGCSATSTGITVTVNPLPTPTLSSDATNNTICAGETITFTAGGGTSYEFFVDNVSQGAASATATFASSTLTNGQVVTATVTNANGCSATSTGVTVTVNPLPTPSLSSSDADNSICVGESVTFTASGADEYIFQVDGATVQAQSATATYTTTGLTNGQVVSVIGVTTATGCQAASTTTFTMTVIPCYEYSGNIVYKNSAETEMGNVALTLTEAGGATYNTTTSVTAGSIGTFSFTDLPGGTYTLTYSTGKTHGGINATDAFRVILDAINFAPLSGLNEEAADVNADNTETATDALLIARRFVGLDNSFPSGDWAFQDQSFTLSGDLTNQKIYSLAYGDVNGSYTPNSTENLQPTVFFVDGDNIEINNGDNVAIPVRISKAATVGAISLSINYPTQGLTINSITMPNGQNVIYNAVNGEVRISWADVAVLTLANDDLMLTINATVNNAVEVVNNPMTLNAISEIADDIAAPYSLVDLVLPTFSTVSTNTNNIVATDLGVRHFPNPFRDFVTIEYDLPATSDVIITITNALGVQVQTLVQETQVAGKQQVRFEANDLASGMYFYTITANDGNNQYRVTKQLMLIK